MPRVVASSTSRFSKGFWVSAAIVTSGGCYAGYVLYNSSFFSERREKLQKLFASLSALADTLSSSSEISATISRDLHQFIISDSDEVPQSLRQVMKLSRCSDFQVALTRFSAAVTQGTLKGICATAPDLQAAFVDNPASPGIAFSTSRSEAIERKLVIVEKRDCNDCLPERLLDKLFSEPGQGFASVVVGKAIRTLVHSYFEHSAQASKSAKHGTRRKGMGGENVSSVLSYSKGSETHAEADQEDWGQPWLNVANSAKGKAIISNIISTFAVTAVSTYLDKTSNMNVCEDVLAAVTKEQYKEPMTEILKSVCSDAIGCFIRTSHEVLTGSQQRAHSSSSSYQDGVCHSVCSTSHDVSDDRFVEASFHDEYARTEQETDLGASSSMSKVAWQEEIGKLLSVPETRQLAVEVAGAMSAHGVRSFSAVCMEMLRSVGSTKSLEGHPGSVRPLGPLRAVAAKALTTASVCLALCLHLVTGSRAMYPSGSCVNGYGS